MNVPTILIVDDEPDNFDVIETLLADRGYRLYYAASGRDALDSIGTFQPHLILLDVMMPEMDGIEVCRRIKADPEWRSIPIMMVTALSSKDDLAHCLHSGADDFISKPVNGVELQARVQSLLRVKQQYDEIHALSQLQNTTITLLENSLDTLRKNLASSLPHELNTPLNGILGGLNLLLYDLDEIPREEMRELLIVSQDAALRLESIVQRLLLYLQLELDAVPDHLFDRSSRLDPIVETVLANHPDRIQRADDITVRLAPVTLGISPQYCQPLIFELVDNALKFSEPGTPIELVSEVQGNNCFFSISSQGRAMTPEQVEAIGAFVQFDRKSYEQQGLGLGLKIVQNIIEAIGGGFAIVSTAPRTTTVRLRLPVHANG